MKDIMLQAVDNGKLITEFYPKSNYKIETDWDQKLKLFKFTERTEIVTEEGQIMLMPDWEVVDGGIIRFPIGLKDRNGKLIYEGDAVKVDNGKYGGVVKFDEQSLSYVIEDKTGGYGFVNGQRYDERPEYRTYEVIGNIYQNKELIP